MVEDPNARWFISCGAIPAFKYYYFYSKIPFLNHVDRQNIYLANNAWGKSEDFIKNVEEFLGYKEAYPNSNVPKYFIFSFSYKDEEELLKEHISKSNFHIIKEEFRSGGALAFVIKSKLR